MWNSRCSFLFSTKKASSYVDPRDRPLISASYIKSWKWILHEPPSRTPKTGELFCLSSAVLGVGRKPEFFNWLQDWANPLVREHIHVYPEVSSTISEIWQADKWLKEIDCDDLSPMWADWANDPHRHFYIKELARLENGDFIIPIRWVVYDHKECADGHPVSWNAEVSFANLFPDT